MSIFFAAPIDEFPDYDKATTTPTSTLVDANFPVANLLTYDPTQDFRSTSTIPVITWDLGGAKEFDVIALISTNLRETATLQIERSSDGTTWTNLQAAGTLALAHSVVGQTTQNKKNMLRKNHTLFNSLTVQTYRYIRLSVNSQVTGLFPSIGRLFVGKKFVPSTGWQYGSNLGMNDLSRRERTDRGALIMDPMVPLPTADVKMEFLNKTEMMDFIYEFNYWRGSAREMLACLDVEDTKYLQKNMLYCTINEGRKISYDAFNTHACTWILESI